jgi:hypothetical protein
MEKNRIGLTLNGDIPLALFAEAMQHFSDLIGLLSHEVGGGSDIEWQISELEAGSASATIVGYSPDHLLVERVVGAYEIIGRALATQAPIPYSALVVKAAKALMGILGEKVTSIDFHILDQNLHISKSTDITERPVTMAAYGTITGVVETVSKRQTLRFTLYDDLFHKAVKCYFEKSQREMMLGVWDKKVTVTGKILRDASIGRPLEIREIEKVEIIIDQPRGDYRRARGILPWKEGDEPAEKTIRRIRDEE